jgi:two-component sensor histidine kinase
MYRVIAKIAACLIFTLYCTITSTAQNNNINPNSMAYDMPEYQKAKELLDNRKYPEAEALIVNILEKLEAAHRTEDYVEMLNLHAKSIMHQWRTDEALEIYKEMKRQAKEANLNQLHSNSIQALSVIYQFKDSFEIVEQLTTEGMQIKGLQDNDYSDYYISMGEIWMRRNNLDSALHYVNVAYDIDKTINDSISLPKTCQTIALFLIKSKKYDKALQYLIEGKSYIQEENSYKHSYFNSEIAQVMFQIRNIDKAKFYAEESVRYARLNDLTTSLSSQLALLASIEETMGNYEIALNHYEEALELNKKPNKTELQIRLTSGIIACILNLNKKVSNTQISELLSLKSKTQNQTALNRIDLLHLRYLTDRNLSVTQFEQKSNRLFKIFEKNNNLYDLRNLSKLKYDFYNKKGDYSAANKALESYMNYKEEIFAEAQEYKILELEAKYDKVQDEKKIEQLALTNNLQANTLKQQTIFLITAAVGFLIISLLSFFLFKYYRKVVAQNKIVEKALEEKDFLLREIHHRVKNNLQVISSLLSLQARQIDNKDIQKAIQEGRNRVRSMALIHQNLYQNENLTNVSVNQYLTKLLKELFNTYNVDSDKIKLKLQLQDIKLDVDTMVPFGLILNELVSNCLKHAFPDESEGTITIELSDDNNQLYLSVRDNGIGIDNNTMLESKSFGNRLIKAFSKKLHADIEIINEEGTTVNLRIKNYKKAS